MILQTERLILRHFIQDDLDLVIEDKNLTHEEAELLYQLFNQK